MDTRHLTPNVRGVVAKVVRRLPVGTDREQLLVEAALAEWQGRSIRRTVIDEARRQWGREFIRVVPVVSIEHSYELAGDGGLDGRIEVLELWRQVDRLPQRERAVILLRYRWNCTLASIAGEVGLAVRRIHQLERQGLRRLRMWME